MSDNETLIHVDFAEKYIGKLSNSVQSAHFGVSQNQITLQTGVYYVGAHGKPNTFCTISESMEHGPAGVWTYISPMLDDIQQKYPNEYSTFC